MSDQPNYYAAPDAQLDPGPQYERDEHASRRAPTTFGGTLSASISLYQKAFVPLIIISFVWGVIDAGTDLAHEWSLEEFLMYGDPLQAAIFSVALLVTFVCSVYFWTVGLKRVENLFQGRPTGGEWAVGIERFLPMVAYFILMGLIIGGIILLSMFVLVFPAFLLDMPSVLIALLMLVAVIPGLIALFFLFVGEVHLVSTGSGPIESLKKSYELIKGIENWFFTFGVVLVMGLAVGLPVFLFACCAGGVTFAATESMTAVDVVVAAMTPFINIVTFPFVLCINYLLYQALLARKNFYYAAMMEDPTDYSQPQYGSEGGQQTEHYGYPGPQQGGPYGAQQDGAQTGQPGPTGPAGPSVAHPGLQPDRPPQSQQGPPPGARQGPPPGADGPPSGADGPADEPPSDPSPQDPWSQAGEDGSVGDDDDDSPVW